MILIWGFLLAAGTTILGLGLMDLHATDELTEAQIRSALVGATSLHPRARMYIDFAFRLDCGTDDDSKRTNNGLVSVAETLRCLDPAMGPPNTTTDPIPMDIDVTLSERLQGGPLNPLPFQLSTSTPSTLTPASLLPAALVANRSLEFTNLDSGLPLGPPTETGPWAPQISVASFPGSVVALRTPGNPSASVNPKSAEIQENAIAGPRLFQPLDDDGME